MATPPIEIERAPIAAVDPRPSELKDGQLLLTPTRRAALGAGCGDDRPGRFGRCSQSVERGICGCGVVAGIASTDGSWGPPKTTAASCGRSRDRAKLRSNTAYAGGTRPSAARWATSPDRGPTASHLHSAGAPSAGWLM